MDATIDIVIFLFILFSAVIFHEYAHGWVAYKLGDPTAKNVGRLTLNPLKHIDIVGTIILPGALLILRAMGQPVFLFGWAKPVPVNFLNLRNPKKDMIWVGIAGPLINIFIAMGCSLFIKLNMFTGAHAWFMFAIFINILLAVFNMVPIPPLDGSRVVMGLLPDKYFSFYAKIERYGIFIVIILLYLGLFEKIVVPIMFFLGQMLGVNLNEIY